MASGDLDPRNVLEGNTSGLEGLLKIGLVCGCLLGIGRGSHRDGEALGQERGAGQEQELDRKGQYTNKGEQFHTHRH